MTNFADPHPYELLSALLDGEATPSERSAVERHLGNCAECRTLLGDFEILARALADQEPPPVPAGLIDALRSRLDPARVAAPEGVAAPRRPWWSVPWRSPLPVAAAASMVAVLALWIVLRRGAPGSGELPLPSPALPEDRLADQVIPSGPEAPEALQDEARSALEKSVAASPPPTARTTAPPPVAARVSSPAKEVEPLPPSADDSGSAATPPPQGARPSVRSSGDAGGETVVPTPERVAPEARVPRLLPASPRPDRAHDLSPAPAGRVKRRELHFEFPEYAGSISEDGKVTLRAESYRCSLRIEDSSESRAAIDSLFALASSAEPARSDVEMVRPEEVPEGVDRERIFLRESGGTMFRSLADSNSSREREGAVAAEVGRRIRDFVQDRLRGPLEERCGPLPPIARPGPSD